MLNSFSGIGRLGRDAELLTTRNGHPMLRFGIAIERIPRKGQITEPDWITCTIFGDRAVTLSPYLTKGMLIGVRGRLQSFRTGGESNRTIVRIDVSEIDFLKRPLDRNPETGYEEQAE